MSGQPVVVLGAGHGRRMGKPKVFAELDGRTFLERILERCRETGSPATLVLDPVFRALAEGLLARIPPPPPAIVEADGNLPMLASLQAVLRGSGGPAGCWCWPVDAPFISALGWQLAVETGNGQSGDIWKLRSGDLGGHPIWLPDWAAAEIAAGDWPRGLPGFFETCPHRIYILTLDAEELRDFDTPEQLAALSATGAGDGEEIV